MNAMEYSPFQSHVLYHAIMSIYFEQEMCGQDINRLIKY